MTTAPQVRKNKGKEKSTVADARSLSLEALQTTVDEQIRKVAELTGLKVSICLTLRHAWPATN